MKRGTKLIVLGFGIFTIKLKNMKRGRKPKKLEYRLIADGVTHVFQTFQAAQKASYELIDSGCDEVLLEASVNTFHYRYTMGFNRPVYIKIEGHLP